MHSESELKQFDKWNVPRPAHQSHGTETDIRSNLTKLKVTRWRLEGNQLIGETDWGPLVQAIPTNYILESPTPDAQGLPRLVKIKHKN